MALQITQWKKSNLCFCEASGFSSKLHFGGFGRWNKGHLKQQVVQSIPSMLSPNKGFLSVCWPFDWWKDQKTHVLLWYLWPCDWQRSRGDWSINNRGNKGWANVNVICLTSRFQGLWLVCLACVDFFEIVYFFPLGRKTLASCGIPPVILPHVYYIRLMLYKN